MIKTSLSLLRTRIVPVNTKPLLWKGTKTQFLFSDEKKDNKEPQEDQASKNQKVEEKQQNTESIKKSDTFFDRLMGNENSSKLGTWPKDEQQKKNMTMPYTPRRFPAMVKLQVGEVYRWCSCGLSKKQPFCDGAHKGTSYKPVKFTAEKETAILCMCKATKDQPFCDMSHFRLYF